MRILGPYKLLFPLGYESQVYNEVYLELGKPLILDATKWDQLTEVSYRLQ
jgi:hypothetical protein